MAKILLCSKKSDYVVASKSIVGFDCNNKFDGTYGFLNTYRKLNIKTTNAYEDGEGYAIGVGTFIYKGKKDSEALSLLWNDVDEEMLCRKKILGSYCIGIFKNSTLRIFIDESSTYNLYYYFDKDRLIVTNTWFHILSCIDSIECNADDILAEWGFCHILDKTSFKNISRLTSNQELFFDGKKWSVRSLKSYFCDFSEDFWNEVKEMYTVLPKLFLTSKHCLTGGQDSRINLALLCSVGMQPTICYGEGDSLTTCTKQKDKDIAIQIADLMHLPFHVMNWRDSYNDDFEEFFHKYGEMACVYGLNTNIIREFETDKNTEFVSWGYFGEEYRSIEQFEDYKKERFTLDDYIDDLFVNKKLKGAFNNWERIRREIYERFSMVCELKSINPCSITKAELQKLNTVYRQHYDVFMNNFSNIFCYSFPLLSNASMLKHVENLSWDRRLKAKFLLEGLDVLCPEMLDICFFSHIKIKKFNREQFQLENEHYVSSIKELIRKIIPNGLFMYLARKAYYYLMGDFKSIAELRYEYVKKKSIGKALKNENLLKTVDIAKLISSYDASRIKDLILLCSAINIAKKYEKHENDTN